MYTVCQEELYLFEIKTEFGAPDWMKGVGQLLVYERVLDKTHRKYLVLPGNVRGAFIKVLTDLDIGVVLYRWKSGRAQFQWPEDMIPGTRG